MSPLNGDRTPGRTTQAQVAYNELRRAITSGELPGGAHIVQSEWADRLDVSITPIREAIRRLEQDGLAISEAHKGTTVTKLSYERAEEIYTLRRVVEPIQFRHANGQLSRPESEARELCLALDEVRDPVEYCDINLRFHSILMGVGKSWTSRVTAFLAVAASPYITVSLHAKPEMMDGGMRQHLELLDALVSGDIERTIELNAIHLEQSLDVLKTVQFPICART